MKSYYHYCVIEYMMKNKINIAKKEIRKLVEEKYEGFINEIKKLGWNVERNLLCANEWRSTLNKTE